MSSLTSVVLLLTVVLLVGLTVVAWRYRTKQGAELFAILEAVSAVWASLTLLGLAVQPGPTRLRIWGVTSGLSLLVVGLWLGFILSYTGRDHWLTVQRFGVVSIPLVVGAGLYVVAPAGTPLVGGVSQETIPAGTVVVSSIGPLGVVLGAYLYLVFLAGLGLVSKTVLEGSRLLVGQAMAFVLGSLVSIVASLLVVLGVAPAGYPLIQVSLGLQAVLWGYAVLGQQLLQIVPAVAEIGQHAVFDNLDDGLLVVDSDGVVVRTNPRAGSYLDDRELTGESIESVLSVMDVETIQDLPTRFEHDRQTYQADASQIRNWRGEQIGHTVVIRDVGQLVTREQRLAVLNRILRHNVRNDMAIVMGIGEQLKTRDDEELVAHGKTMNRTARGLTRVSEKAIEVNRMFEEPVAEQRVQLPATIGGVVSQLAGDYPDATVQTSIDVETVRTDRRIFRKVLEEVVANALEHAGSAPTVRIECARREADLELTVADDGPGIPESELDPVVCGEVTALEHASSLGLWFVNWGTQALGGTVDITTTEAGTQVTVRIPDSVQAGGGRNETRESPLVT